MMPLGNLVVSGSYSASGADGVGVWAHKLSPIRAVHTSVTTFRLMGKQFPRERPISLVIRRLSPTRWSPVNRSCYALWGQQLRGK